MRTIATISYAEQIDMGGFPVRQPLPSKQINMLDPFLLLHHATINYSKQENFKEAGVGPHPHRGFSPVSFIYQGGVHHRDSLGNDSIIKSGGTQWINAGKGIIHSERPVKSSIEKGETQEFLQLWVNVPAAKKMDEPNYQPLEEKSTPKIIADDGLVSLAIIAGEFEGVHGPIHTPLEINAINATLKQKGEYVFTFPQEHNLLVYLLDGSVEINNEKVIEGKNLIAFNQDGESIKITAKETTRMLIVSGKPIKEPVVSYGPFVMNNRTELVTAINDYNDGKMGELIEKF